MTDLRGDFVAARGFPLDSFQERALDALDRGRNVLVSAPTGSGKTLVAEYALGQALAAGEKVFYTTPIKALSNQKFRDLAADLGSARVGLLTGDNSIRGDAPVVVMTTEVLRNMIYAGSETLRGLHSVILDEVHYLQDRARGSVWEEVIVHLPAVVRLVCLSATVANADEFAAWLETVRGHTDAIVEGRRPVELDHYYAVGERTRDDVLLVPTFVRGRPNPEGTRYDARHPRRRRGQYGPPRRVELLERLDEQKMLPAIVFVFSRDGCDAAVDQCRTSLGRLTTEAQRSRIRAIAEEHTDGLDDSDLRLLGYGRWLDALESGLAAHHAGMVPPMKEAVEEAFIAGLVKVVFATETLALGVNMPARSVVIERLTKFTGERHEYLTPGEYTQLTGRAGRRGIDDRGYATVCWSPWTAFGEVAALASAAPAPLRSSFRTSYNTAANLVRRYEPDEARRLLDLSFAQFHADRDVASMQRELERRRGRLESLRRAASPDESAAAKAASLEKAVARLERRIRQRSRRLARQLDRVLDVLTSWGYVDGWQLTEGGELLARLYAEADLLVAESARTGLLDGLDLADLAAVVSSFTYDRRGRDDTSELPGGVVGDRLLEIERLWRTLAASEEDAGIPETRPPDPGFALTIHRWVRGDRLDALLEDDQQPGDFVRSVKQSVDLLRQLGDVAPEPLATTARRAARSCLRDLVEASTVVGG